MGVDVPDAGMARGFAAESAPCRAVLPGLRFTGGADTRHGGRSRPTAPRKLGEVHRPHESAKPMSPLSQRKDHAGVERRTARTMIFERFCLRRGYVRAGTPGTDARARTRPNQDPTPTRKMFSVGLGARPRGRLACENFPTEGEEKGRCADVRGERTNGNRACEGCKAFIAGRNCRTDGARSSSAETEKCFRAEVAAG